MRDALGRYQAYMATHQQIINILLGTFFYQSFTISSGNLLKCERHAGMGIYCSRAGRHAEAVWKAMWKGLREGQAES